MVKRAKPKRKRPLTIIGTHVNADFDAIGSLLAAQKIYPGAMVVFPSAQEKNLRHFFISSLVYLFNMADIKGIDFDQVGRLVIVDTKRSTRIGKLAELLENPEIEVHIFDHHPQMPGDIVADHNVTQKAGSTVTILTKQIQQQKISLTADEATVMCLGIYEDTGSFTFSSTTEDDLQAAAFLLSQGANLDIISNMISREINPEQVGLLNDMIQAAHRYRINNTEVVVLSVSTERYIPDFAFLVHKLIKMENYPAIFALARMINKIYIVARSRIPEVDAGAILSELGGGGHAFAAAATVKDQTLAQTESLLVDILNKKVSSRQQARDLMTSPPISVPPYVSCQEASKLLTRYNINALLVVEKQAGQEFLRGFISRQVIEKALSHALDQIPVHEYMSSEIVTAHPEADIFEIQEKIIEHKQRILPIVENGKILGVVTRNDLLNLLVFESRRKNGRLPEPDLVTVGARTRNVIKFLRERLSVKILEMLESIGRIAEEIECNAYVVGGFVRDLFLYRPNEDIDIVIEGNGIAFAKRFAQKNGVRFNAYEKFGTAVIIFPDGFKIDVASARTEHYESPAALPTVEMSSIKLDLFRRDFTINTLSIQLNPSHFGTLIDFFSAQRDLKEKAIRILHNLSFVEDPTRVFRAIRFEQRFGFSIGKLTSGLIENAVRMEFFKRISGRRIFSEFRQILEEENPTPAIIRLNDYNLLQVIHRSIQIDKKLITKLNATKKVISWYDLLYIDAPYQRWMVFLCVIIGHGERENAPEICKRLELPPRYQRVICAERDKADACLHWLEYRLPLKNSQLYDRLFPFKTELALYMMAVTKHEKVKRAISTYFSKLRNIKPFVKGEDLKQLGIVPGPIYRNILQAVLDAKLNGELKTKEEELELIRRYAP